MAEFSYRPRGGATAVNPATGQEEESFAVIDEPQTQSSFPVRSRGTSTTTPIQTDRRSSDADYWASQHPVVETQTEEQGRLSSAFNSVIRTFGKGVASIPKAIGEGAVALANKYGDDPIWGNPDKVTPEETTAWKAGDAIEKWFAKFESNPEYKDEFLASQLPDGAGYMLSFIAGGVAGRMAKVPAAATTATIGSAASGVELVEDYLATIGENEKADPELRADALKLGALLGTSEAAPIARMFNRLDKITNGAVKKVIASGVKGGLEELTQEVLQTIGQNYVASDVLKYDPERGLWSGTKEGAEVGFTLGFAMNSLAAMIAGRRANKIAKEKAAETAPPVDTTPEGITPEGTPAPELVTPVYESVEDAAPAIEKVAMAFAKDDIEAQQAVQPLIEDLEKSFGRDSADEYINAEIAKQEGLVSEQEAIAEETPAVGEEGPAETITTPEGEPLTQTAIPAQEAVPAAPAVLPEKEQMAVPDVPASGVANTEGMKQAAGFVHNALLADKQYLNAKGAGRQGTLTAREDLADDLLQNVAVITDGLKTEGYDTSKLEAVLGKPVVPAKRTKGYRKGALKDVGRANLEAIKKGDTYASGLRFFAHKNSTYRIARDETGAPFKEHIRGKKGKISHADISGFIDRVRTELQTMLDTGPQRGLVIKEKDKPAIKKPATKKKEQAIRADTVTEQEQPAVGEEAEAIPGIVSEKPETVREEAKAEKPKTAAPTGRPVTGDTTVSEKIKAKARKAAAEAEKAAKVQKKPTRTRVARKKRAPSEGAEFAEKAAKVTAPFPVTFIHPKTGVETTMDNMPGNVALSVINRRIARLEALRECMS